MRRERTADNDAKEHAGDEVPHCHAEHDTRDGNVFRGADAMPRVPEGLLNEVDAQHEDESAHQHDGLRAVHMSACMQNRTVKLLTNVCDRPSPDQQEDGGSTCEEETRDAGVATYAVKPAYMR